jgi:uncharacterized damage-inducible protein DinB
MRNQALKLYLGSFCLASVLLTPAFSQAPAQPLVKGQRDLHAMVQNNLVRAAAKMPEENYSFKPAPEVKTFAQMVGHVADAQYLFCSAVSGDKNPAPGVEKNLSSKADLVKALNDAFAFCDKAYDGMTDAKAAEVVKFFGTERLKLSIMTFNTMHNMEHYGNIVTYMRIKGLVPPSSEGR